MEDRCTPVLHLELGDSTPDVCARRAEELSQAHGVARVSWWDNGAPGRTDLPMRVRDGRTLLVVEADDGFTAPAALPETTEAHRFRRGPRPSQGVVTGAPTRGLLIVWISPRNPEDARRLRDWGDFVHIRHIAAAGIPGFTQISVYENGAGRDPLYMHFYEFDSADAEATFSTMTDYVAPRLGGMESAVVRGLGRLACRRRSLVLLQHLQPPGRGRLDDGMTDLDAARDAWRRDGFVVLPEFLAGPQLRAAVAELAQVFPTAEEFHADPCAEHNLPYGSEFGGLVPFPFPSVALCNLVACAALVDLAEAVFGTQDVRVYAAELWAKYSGVARYEQEHHRDYLNHTPLAPSSDHRWRGLELFVWLCDVPEDLGPTHVVPLAVIGRPPGAPARLPAGPTAGAVRSGGLRRRTLPARCSPTARRRSIAAPSSLWRVLPGSAPTSATAAPMRTGSPATPGASSRSGRSGDPSSSKRRSGSCSSSGSRRPVTRTGRPRPSPACAPAIPGST